MTLAFALWVGAALPDATPVKTAAHSPTGNSSGPSACSQADARREEPEGLAGAQQPALAAGRGLAGQQRCPERLPNARRAGPGRAAQAESRRWGLPAGPLERTVKTQPTSIARIFRVFTFSRGRVEDVKGKECGLCFREARTQVLVPNLAP